MLKLHILGNITSSKNSRIITRSGASHPKKAYKDFVRDAMLSGWDGTQLKRADGPLIISGVIFKRTKRGDLDNFYTAVQDALKHWGVIEDDDFVCQISVKDAVDKHRPGAYLLIEQTNDSKVLSKDYIRAVKEEREDIFPLPKTRKTSQRRK